MLIQRIYFGTLMGFISMHIVGLYPLMSSFFFRLRNPTLDVTFFMEVHSSENPRTKWGIVHCHVCLMEVTVQGNSTKQSGLQQIGVAFTLWLCQNSY